MKSTKPTGSQRHKTQAVKGNKHPFKDVGTMNYASWNN